MSNPLSDEDVEALKRIDEMIEEIQSAADSLARPMPGAELHHDGELTAIPEVPAWIVHSAMTSALCALQGFQALWLGIERLQRTTTFAFVHRGALLGACEAFWILRPKSQEIRVARSNTAALRRVVDELDSKTDLRTMDRIFQDDRLVTDAELDDLRDSKLRLSQSIGGAPSSITTMFKEVAADLVNDEYFADEDAEHFSQVLRSQWRISSADAHGGSWQHRFSDPLALDQDETSDVERRDGDVGMVIAKAYTAAGIAYYAAHLWHERMRSDG